ncbi:YcxB-like protein [Cognatiyoonia koreensis]|uniref:YcxB-like protein n=1 Tax=Cognatiyoonia koreensis TaxID=364200 RepID=A0A1I0REI8_9RHOB|nr:YcxB family protein [Cognatiyoonia koreensis]SEW39095.1 YcxB-like protein [Cognatiyoonia koreensis]
MTTYIAEFEGDHKAVLQSMFASGNAITSWRVKIAGFIQYLAMGFIAPIGLLGLAMFFFRDFVRDNTLLVSLVAFAIGWGIASLTRLIYAELAKSCASSPFGAHQRVEISENGFVLRSRNSHWQTGWADISAVLETKRALCVVASGVALYVPKAELDDPTQTFSDMQRWHKASVFA